MILLRLLGWRGAAALAAALCLGLLLALQKAQTRHWTKQSAQFEQLYSRERAAHAGTVANYRAAAAEARAADAARLSRVAAEQRAINERTENDFEARLAAARSLARRLRGQSAAADSGGRRAASVPDLPAAPGRASEAAGEDGFSLAERQIATEQAIQLDELIKWVRRQAAVPPNGGPGARQPGETAAGQHEVEAR